MEHLQRFLTRFGEEATGLILDPGCVTGIIMIIILVYAIVNIIWVILERRRKRLTQTRRNERASWEGYTMIQKCSAGKKRKPKTRRDLRWGCIDRTTIHRHGWERYRQSEIRRSVEPAPPVKAQLLEYVRRRFRELLQ